MAFLREVSSFAAAGAMPIYEKGGQLFTVTCKEHVIALKDYPEINLSGDASTTAGTSSRSIKPGRSVLVPVNEGFFRRVVRTFFESGFAAALKEAQSAPPEECYPAISTTANVISQSLKYLQAMKLKIFPHLQELDVADIVQYSETRNWDCAQIRYIAWHPNCFKLAIAGGDDSIRIYTKRAEETTILKSGLQKWITCMHWRPWACAELAVGCQKGVCLWSPDNMHRLTSQVYFIKHPNNCPVTSMQWSSDGILLAISSIADTDVFVYHIGKMQHVKLKRIGQPCSILKWSADGSALFASTTENVFRVWTTDEYWVPERWTTKTGRIQSACWSPCGSYIVFVNSEEPILYRIQYREQQLFKAGEFTKHALPIADLSRFEVNQRLVGGHPLSLAWDPEGLYLAVIFKDSPCVIIYSTCVQNFKLNISPRCFISGIDSEYPLCIVFQSKNHSNSESVLTIGWSSGRVQFFPFLK